MTTKYAERLIILKETGEALLQRLFHVKSQMSNPKDKPIVFQTPEGNMPNLTKLFKALEKNFPEFPEKTIESTAGYDFIKAQSQKILQELQPIYYTFCEIVEWSEHSQRLLEEICTSANVEFDNEINLLFLTDFLSVMTLYAKLVLLLNRLDERRPIVSIFNLVFSKSNGQSDPNINRLAKFFQDFDNPWKKLQENFFGIQRTVGSALLHLNISYDRASYSFLTSKRPLELLSDPDKIPYPSVERPYFDYCYYDQIREWFIFGFALCPEANSLVLSSTSNQITQSISTGKNKDKTVIGPDSVKGLDILKKILSEHAITTLYGNETLNVTEPFDELFKNYKSSTISLKKEKKNIYKPALEKFTSDSAKDREMRRNYIRLQLKSLFFMITDNPGLLGPKFQLLLGCLSLAKSEIMWFFRHLSETQNDKMKRTNSIRIDFSAVASGNEKDGKANDSKSPVDEFDQWADDTIPELIYLIDEIYHLCMQHQEVIRTYYADILKRLYLRQATELYDQHKQKFEPIIAQVFERIIQDIQSCGSDSNLEGLRLNWKRLLAYLSGANFRANLQDSSLRMLFQTLNKVYAFSRHVDEIEQQLIELSSLKELYFYHTNVIKIFKNGLLGNNEPFYCMSLIKILNYYPENVNRNLNPELRKKVATDSTELANKMLNAMVKVVDNNVHVLVGSKIGFGFLANQLGGEQAANIYKLRQAKQNEPPKPGFESTYEGRETISNFASIVHRLTQILYSFSLNEEISVYDTYFYPLEYLRDKLQVTIIEYLRNLCNRKIESMPKDLLKSEFIQPSVLKYKIQTYISTIKSLEQCVHNLNVEELLLNGLLEHFVHLDYCYNDSQMDQTSAYTVNTTSEEVTMVLKHVKWYNEVVSNPFKYKFLYHPLKKLFASTKETPIISYKLEDFFDFQELVSLVDLIGPLGIRTFDNMLLNQVFMITEKIRDFLSNSLSVFKEIENDLFTNENILDIVQRKFKNYDQLLQLATTLGSILMFRLHLHEALEMSTSKSVPLLVNFAKSVQTQYRENLFRDDRFLNLDGLLLETGVFSNNHIEHHSLLLNDNGLKKSLAPLAENSSAWEVLPLSFALLTASGVWASHPYDVILEGWDNNAHLAIYGFHALMIGVHCTKQQSIVEIEREYEKFSEYAGQILLLMRANKSYDKQLNSSCIFADQITKTSPFQKASRMIERVHPYSLIRSVYVQTYEQNKSRTMQNVNIMMQQQGSGVTTGDSNPSQQQTPADQAPGAEANQ